MFHCLEQRRTVEGVSALLYILEQIGHTMAEAHSLGISIEMLLREISFLPEEGRPRSCSKLLDFGLVELERHLSTAKQRKVLPSANPRYMSPEQARGDGIDSRSEIYSLAIIAYEMGPAADPIAAVRIEMSSPQNERPPSGERRSISGIQVVQKSLGQVQRLLEFRE